MALDIQEFTICETYGLCYLVFFYDKTHVCCILQIAHSVILAASFSSSAQRQQLHYENLPMQYTKIFYL